MAICIMKFAAELALDTLHQTALENLRFTGVVKSGHFYRSNVSTKKCEGKVCLQYSLSLSICDREIKRNNC